MNHDQFSSPIQLRPHHGLCIQHYEGKGYSAEFTRHMNALIDHLNKNPKTMLKLQCHTDILCGHCPHNDNEVCESAQKVARIDHAVLETCGCKEGDLLSTDDYFSLVREKIIDKRLEAHICKNCQWLDICIH